MPLAYNAGMISILRQQVCYCCFRRIEAGEIIFYAILMRVLPCKQSGSGWGQMELPTNALLN